MFSIYVEGYAATGDGGTAQFVCSSPGSTFQEACDNAYKAGKFRNYGNYDGRSLWGCRLYPTLEEASRSFG